MSKKFNSIVLIPFMAAVILLVTQGAARAGEERAILTPPPQVPPPITRNEPATVIVDLEALELKGRLSDGVEYNFYTFNGTVPGPFIRVRTGDTVEVHLKNYRTNRDVHSIDIQAVNGPGGGSTVTQTLPGGENAFRWKAQNPGLYIYQCATPHIPTHIANGMYGLIFVEPAGGMSKVDREYYVVQGEFYTTGRHGEKGFQYFSLDKERQENPEYVVFNGSESSLTGTKALKAKVGETIRLFIGNGGPNLISSFHIIGEIFDAVYHEGVAGAEPATNIQTILVPPGGTGIVEFRADVPGSYILVDHSMSRAIDKGATGVLEVTGEQAPEIFKPLKLK